MDQGLRKDLQTLRFACQQGPLAQATSWPPAVTVASSHSDQRATLDCLTLLSFPAKRPERTALARGQGAYAPWKFVNYC